MEKVVDKEFENLIKLSQKPITEDMRINWYKDFFKTIMKYTENSKALYRCKSCMFVGKTVVDKIQLTYNILHSYGLKEWNGKEGDFVFIDSEKRFRSYNLMSKIIVKYKDIKFVVITNCANILRNDHKTLAFKYLNEDNERTIHHLGKNISVSSHYVLLSDIDSRDKLKTPQYGEMLKQRVDNI